MDFLEERTHHYMKVVTEDETFLGRTRNIGTMTYEQADFLGAVGPTAAPPVCSAMCVWMRPTPATRISRSK